jgi:2-amino-4-hydroxy-6-hydroxymethyldihydropteridine diphosphokinase
MEVALSLGSNLGDRLENLQRARERLAAIPGVVVESCSPIYETEPMDVASVYAHQRFLNAVLIVQSVLEPFRLACHLHEIESEMGRVRSRDRNAPRTVDIDVIYADGIQTRDPNLTLPHPRWSERRFVVQPLADLRPDRVLPGQGRTVREVLLSLPPKPNVVLFAQLW